MLFINTIVLPVVNTSGVLIQWCSVVLVIDIVLLSFVKISGVHIHNISGWPQV